jgi:hypothetical protein
MKTASLFAAMDFHPTPAIKQMDAVGNAGS